VHDVVHADVDLPIFQANVSPSLVNHVTAGRNALRLREKYMGELLTPTHLMVIAVIAFLVFGGNKLPELGKGLGEGLRGFKDGINGLTGDTTQPATGACVGFVQAPVGNKVRNI
jgi:sec-independent protein translocase protein TatA